MDKSPHEATKMFSVDVHDRHISQEADQVLRYVSLHNAGFRRRYTYVDAHSLT